MTLAGAVKTGTLAAGAPVTLCVITTMTAPNIASQGNNSLAATIKAKIDVGTWSATRESAAFTQNVAVSAPLVQQSSRNNIMNANQCVAGRNNIVSRNNVCGYNDNGQVRITSDGSGNYFIARAKNSSEQPTAPRWSLTSATGDVTTVAPSNASSQKWKLITRPDGLLRIESVAFPDYCATVSWTWDYTTNGYLIKGSLCNDSLASQGFSLAPVGSPVPAVPYPIVCTRNDGAGYLNLTWGFDPEYQQEQKFRVVVSGKVVTPNYIHDYTATSHLYPANLAAQSIAYGPSVTINIEQSIAGSPWEVVATRTISYTSPGVVMCS